jgi:hypothetical protein
MLHKGQGIAGGQRASGNQELAMVTQMFGKPQAIIQHRYHTIDTDHLSTLSGSCAQGIVSTHKSTIQQVHLMSRLLQAGSEIAQAQWRKPKNGAVTSWYKKGVNE